MIQVTLNLENEHVLSEDIKGLLGSLTKEQIQEVASKALFKYLTDTIDYEKEVYIIESIAESRKKGINASSSWHSKTIEELKDMSDDNIKNSDAFKNTYLKSYKSSKESRFEEINGIIDKEITKKATEFISSNNDLNNLVTKKQEVISENFETLVKETMLSVATSLIFGTINNANMGINNMSQQVIIQDILARNNLH